MQTLSRIYNSKIEVKKSTFLSYLVPIVNFKEFHEFLKTEHTKAAHIVWAYRELNKYDRIVENQSDDGEPKGTGGQPSLNALRGVELINVGVFVVRYFGGIKLGTGGLVRAYGSAVNSVIDEAKFEKFKQKDKCVFFVPFALMGRFEHFFESRNLAFEREFNINGAVWSANFDEAEFEKFYEFAERFETVKFSFLALPLSSKRIF
ncbi:MAG: IMPACT family protein [Campylobacter sp.]|nr:IMPACT family protein [Campylobacter sp.]